MKKNYFLLILMMLCLSTQAQIVNIPDANFKAALVNYSPSIDTNRFATWLGCELRNRLFSVKDKISCET